MIKSLASFVAIFALVFVLSGMSAAASSGSTSPNSGKNSPNLTQYFQDVAVGSFWYNYTSYLYTEGISSGYPCNSAPQYPCVGPGNLPYYDPSRTVGRGEMAKFIDLARTTPFYISGNAGITADFETTSGGEALYARCNTAGNNCYAVEGSAADGDRSGYFSGGTGVYIYTGQASTTALDSEAGGATTYAGYFTNGVYRDLYVGDTTDGFFNGYFVGASTAGFTTVRVIGGGVNMDGNLVVGGSKTGYVVDVMKNAGSDALEPGDVVVMAGSSSDAVLGQIPVPSITKATTAYDSAVVGIVDQAMYVPDAGTKAAYDAQQKADNDAHAAYAAAMKTNGKTNLSPVANIANRIPDMVGTLHATDATDVPASGYCNVVTLGSYKQVKVDASFGAIHPGDLLTTSSHAGYAMKADPAKAKMGSIIGKAMGNLDSGSGMITVLVTLK